MLTNFESSCTKTMGLKYILKYFCTYLSNNINIFVPLVFLRWHLGVLLTKICWDEFLLTGFHVDLLFSKNISVLIKQYFLVHRATVTNYHKFAGLTQQKLAQFCRPKVQNRNVGKASLLPVALGENPFLPRAFLGFRPQSLQTANIFIALSHLFQGYLWWHLGPTWTSQDTSRSLMTSAKTLCSNKGKLHRFGH